MLYVNYITIKLEMLKKAQTTHSSILANRTPWTEEPGGLYSPWGRKEWDTTEHFERYKTGTHLHSLLHWLHLMWPHIIFRLELQVSICPLMLTGRDPSEISQTCHLRITRFNVSCKGHYLFFYP